MPSESPNGGPSTIGDTFTRMRRRWGMNLSSFSPRLSTIDVSCAPHDTTGTMGTPVRSASLMKPVRPAKSIWLRSLQGRKTSWSPPGNTTRLPPSRSTCSAASWPASMAPARRTYLPMPGRLMKKEWNRP